MQTRLHLTPFSVSGTARIVAKRAQPNLTEKSYSFTGENSDCVEVCILNTETLICAEAEVEKRRRIECE